MSLETCRLQRSGAGARRRRRVDVGTEVKKKQHDFLVPTFCCGLDGRAALISRDSLRVDYRASLKQQVDQVEISCTK